VPASEKNFDPIKATFADISPIRVFVSSCRVFCQIWYWQGLNGAIRVIPIIWTIIVAVRGFAAWHAFEYQRLSQLKESGHSLEEACLSDEQYEYFKKLGQWLRIKLHKLGPTFIKIGQTLSTRADLVPLPALIELSSLQEDAEPYANEIAFDTIKRELGQSKEKLFLRFDATPIAAASLSQAYSAVLHDGRDVVVKVQRPDLDKIVIKDIQVLKSIALEVMKYPSLCRHTDWVSIVSEFSRTILEEIDYIREGKNADRFRHNFRNSEYIYIPRIIWRLTGRRVLTIEYVSGAKVTDNAALDAMGIDKRELTKIGANFYLQQLLEHGFFHADPHPGNMRVMPDGRIGIFDFGMVGNLSPDLKESMVNALLHVIKRQYRELVDDFVNMGFLTPYVDGDKLSNELTPIVDARFQEELSKVRFRKVVFDFSDIVYRYPFRLPSEFTYVMRALLTLEGVAIVICPEFNFIEAVLPFASRLMLKNKGIKLLVLKEVFPDGHFSPQAAINLFKNAHRMSSQSKF
jgi:predicted unusual protein kinase regulating ubiquinone biosynthesis (AarF/ABC1/UbiB family)